MQPIAAWSPNSCCCPAVPKKQSKKKNVPFPFGEDLCTGGRSASFQFKGVIWQPVSAGEGKTSSPLKTLNGTSSRNLFPCLDG